MVTSTPRYKYSLLEHIKSTRVEERKNEVLKYLNKVQFLVNDLNKNNLYLIDFEELSTFEEESYDINYAYLEYDIKLYTGLIIKY